DCARSAVCKNCETRHTGLTGTAETSRLSPRNGFTAYTSSPRGSGLSCPRCRQEIPADVAPGSRRQDHTTSPYAAGSFAIETATPIASCTQRVVTMAIRPSWRARDGDEYSSDLRNSQVLILITRIEGMKVEIGLISLVKFAFARKSGNSYAPFMRGRSVPM